VATTPCAEALRLRRPEDGWDAVMTGGGGGSVLHMPRARFCKAYAGCRISAAHLGRVSPNSCRQDGTRSCLLGCKQACTLHFNVRCSPSHLRNIYTMQRILPDFATTTPDQYRSRRLLHLQLVGEEGVELERRAQAGADFAEELELQDHAGAAIQLQHLLRAVQDASP